MSNKSILIAGSSGIIGTFLFNEMKMKSYNIICISKSKHAESSFLMSDFSRIEEVRKTLESVNNIDVLIFLVALAHNKGTKKDIDFFRLTNYQTLSNLLQVLEEKKSIPQKIIFTSTISVYGEKLGISTYEENSETTPLSPYAVTKLEAENLLLRKYADKTWILRLAPVYSSHFTLNIDRRTKIKNLTYRVGSGKNKLSLLSIKNILITIEEIINANIPAGIYNLSDKPKYRFLDLLLIHQSKSKVIIPKFIIKLIYIFNKLIKNNFINENSIKLISDNIYPSDKIQQYINLEYDLFNTLDKNI